MASTRFAVIAAVVSVLALPATSLGNAPIVDRYPFQSDEVFEGCGFPVRIQIEGKAIDHVFLNDAGQVVRLVLNGPFKAVLTNQTAPETTMTVQISGSLDFQLNEDGSHVTTIRGPWILFYRPESLATPTLVPWLFLFTGERVLTVAPDGTREHVTWRGRFVDLCAELAAD